MLNISRVANTFNKIVNITNATISPIIETIIITAAGRVPLTNKTVALINLANHTISNNSSHCRLSDTSSRCRRRSSSDSSRRRLVQLGFPAAMVLPGVVVHHKVSMDLAPQCLSKWLHLRLPCSLQNLFPSSCLPMEISKLNTTLMSQPSLLIMRIFECRHLRESGVCR